MGGLLSLLFGAPATPAPTDTPSPAPTFLPTAAPIAATAVPMATSAPFVTTAPPATTAAPATAAPAPWAPTNPAWSQLNLSGWGRCLGYNLLTYNCDRVPGSLWAADANGLVVNQGTGQCLQAGAAAQGAALATAGCQPGNALQQWSRDGNRLRLKSTPGLVAEVPGYDYSRPLALWADNGGGNQAWINT